MKTHVNIANRMEDYNTQKRFTSYTYTTNTLTNMLKGKTFTMIKYFVQ